MMNKYKVPATMYTYLTLEVSAESEEEAFAIARDTDGSHSNQGVWVDEGFGDWEVGQPVLLKA